MQRGGSSLDPDRPAATYKSQESNNVTKVDMVEVAVAEPGPDNAASKSSKKKMWIIGATVAILLAGAGAATAIILLKKKDSTSSNSSGAGNTDSSTNGGSKNPTIPPVSGGDLGGSGNSSTPGATTTTPVNPTSDPEKATVAFTMLAIGDWGSTTGKETGIPGSCCKLYKNQIDTSNPRYNVDFWSQKHVAALMGQSAAQLKPTRIIAHGDNFYWNGIGSLDWKYRFEETFEKMYDAPSLQGVKWVNVAGNHDVGGSMFLCGEQDNLFVECTSTAEMLKYLDERFNLQAQYKSPNQDRWLMKDHYYVESVKKDDVSVDIFNIDTNYADSHGARQICCQCYGYSMKYGYDSKKCNDVNAGDAACAGGNSEMYNACMQKINAWATDSYTQVVRDLKASTATFKIINTHYSPHFHMTPEKMRTWYKLTKDYGVSAWFNGHTHGFNHDVANWGTHFFENGGGGGIVTETSTGAQNEYLKNTWVAAGNPYGFMELSFSKDWLKVQFVTFDSAWKFGGLDYSKTVKGGLQRGHCWFVPSAKFSSAGAVGVACKDSVDGPIGAPIR